MHTSVWFLTNAKKIQWIKNSFLSKWYWSDCVHILKTELWSILHKTQLKMDHSKGHKLAVRRWVHSGDLRHSIMITVNDIVLYIPKLLRDKILNVLTTEKERKLRDLTEVSGEVTVVIILQYINVSNQHVVHLKTYTMLYLFYFNFWKKNHRQNLKSTTTKHLTLG